MTYVAEVLADNPLVYWRLGETTGTAAVDSSPNGRNGVYGPAAVKGETGLLVGDSNAATRLPGANADSYVFHSFAAWQQTAAVTVEFLVKPAALTGILIARSDWSKSYGINYSWTIWVGDTAGRVYAEVFINNTATRLQISSTAPVLTVGVTTHLALTYDGTTARLYANGTEVASGTLVGTLSPGNQQIVVGRGTSTTIARANATYDEVAIYSTALSAARIAAHASATVVADGDTTFAGTLPMPTGSASISVAPQLTLSGALPMPTGSASLRVDSHIVVVGSPVVEIETAIQGLDQDITIFGSVVREVEVGLGGSVPINAPVVIEIEEAINGSLPVETDTGNRVGGRVRESTGSYEWEPAIVNPPADIDIAVQYDTLNVFSNVTYPTADSQPVYTVNTARRLRYRDRILIGNKDITWWRGASTPMPDYQLIEPMLYGPASMEIPQVAAAFETPGKGALSFMRKGAPVRVQRVDQTTGEVVATDYKGFITAYRISGGDLSLDIGGQLSGKAGLQNRQLPLFKSQKDIGWYIYHAIRGVVPTAPRLGTVTGIKAYSFGGMSLADYINELCTMGQKEDGTIYSLMPDDEGVYRFLPKDKETVHATVYFDDERMKPDMSQDMAEEPNRIYATGVTPAGIKIKFGVYPGLVQGTPPPYPFNDNRVFGAGTTDADTDTGDGISVMINKLAVHKYILYSSDGYVGGYDADITRAIKRLQEDAGLAQTGNMNLKTWNSLYDIDATGYSLNWSHIEPAAQRTYTRRWYRTGSGALRRKNPNYDPTRLKVDFNIDVGTGYTRPQIKNFAEIELREEDNWLGSVESKLAVHKGLHVPGETVSSADVMSLRDVKPGMNLWAPLWDGGTLFHVSGASVSDQGRSVSLVLDTQFRDTMKVWQIIERNFQTRMDPSRAWVQAHRRSQMTNDTVITWDEIGGIIDGSVKLKKDQWTVFPVLAGQEGTIQRLKIRTNPNAEFCTAMFGYKINPKKLKRLIGNPLTTAGALNWQDPVILNKLDEENVLIYIAGNQEAPCGYYPYDKQDGGTRTGNWEDDAGIAYRTFKHPVIYVAIWSDRDAVVPAGRILWPQQEEGS